MLLELTGGPEGKNSIAISPDGKMLSSGNDDATIRLRETATGKEIFSFVGHNRMVLPVNYSPDGKTLASGSWDSTIRLWDVATGQEYHKFETHGDIVMSVAFSPDGKRLASGHSNSMVMIWDVFPAPSTGSVKSVTPETLEPHWRDLGGDRAARAYAAISILSHGGKGVVPYLRTRLKPIPVDESRSKRILWLISDLDHDDVDVRDKATRELTTSPDAEPILLEKMPGIKSPEAISRINQILVSLNPSIPYPPGEPLRRWRAMQVLERIGSKEAREVLEMLEKDSPSLRERNGAKAALERLDRSR